MPARSLMRMVMANTMRSPRHFVLSSFGIVIGIAAFVFSLALSSGVEKVVLGVFPLEEVEVIAPSVSLAGKDLTRKLGPATVSALTALPDVAEALPRMALAFEAYGAGTFEGTPLNFEVGGFADGVDPSFIDDPYLSTLFKDWETEEPQRVACQPVADHGRAPPPSSCPNPDRYYCDAIDNTCHHRVPVLLSPALLEIYNTQFARSRKGLPIIDEELAKFIAKRGLARMSFSLYLGDTIIAGFDSSIQPGKRRRVEAVLIGISSKAMRPFGVTMPIQYIQRWNSEFRGEEAGSTYSSIMVTLEGKDQLGAFAKHIMTHMDLRLKDSIGESFASVIAVVTGLLVGIALVIITISAVNIGHNLFMQVSDRRREIGVLRAVGATRADVLWLVLLEAAVIGVVSGIIGIGVAFAASRGFNWYSAHYWADFPYKPDDYFGFHGWILAGGVGFSTLFSVLGGYLPARRAALMEPSAALAQN
jgi:ABC-type antimicrobial peptide transport system permease subunit